MYDIDYTVFLNRKNGDTFDRAELLIEARRQNPEVSEASVKAYLHKMLESGLIGRIGRNAYCSMEKKSIYYHEYSELALRVMKYMSELYTDLDFRIFELSQVNEFFNHQLAHNTVFVSVEKELGSFVFDALKEEFAGKLLINPTKKMYHQYWSDNMVVINKLTTEAPKGKVNDWRTDLEKMLVDIKIDKVISSTFEVCELPQMYEAAFDKYLIDESQMFRYARRRGAEGKIRSFIDEETDVELRLGKTRDDNKGKLLIETY